MKIQQKTFSNAKGWQTVKGKAFNATSCHFVMAFGSPAILYERLVYETIRNNYPNATIMMNAIAGKSFHTRINADTLSLTAVSFERAKIKTIITQANDAENSFETGLSLASSFNHANLTKVFLISDGHKINWSEIVLGLQENLPAGTIIAGISASDGARYKTTLNRVNEPPIEGRIVAIGFYGTIQSAAYRNRDGRRSFNSGRSLPKSEENLLHELDGKPALDIYQLYLAEYAKELTGSGLLFPLSHALIS